MGMERSKKGWAIKESRPKSQILSAGRGAENSSRGRRCRERLAKGDGSQA